MCSWLNRRFVTFAVWLWLVYSRDGNYDLRCGMDSAEINKTRAVRNTANANADCASGERSDGQERGGYATATTE